MNDKIREGINLESIIFRTILIITFLILVLFLSIDYSVGNVGNGTLLEVIGIAFVCLFFVIHKFFNRDLKFLISCVMSVLVLFSWYFVGGLTVPVSAIFFVSIIFTLFLVKDKVLKPTLFFWLLVVCIIVPADYLLYNRIRVIKIPQNIVLIHNLMLGALLIGAALIVYYVKSNYNKVRKNLHYINGELINKNAESQSQNEVLVQLNEELTASRNYIAEINHNLESQVQERTSQLEDANKELDVLLYRSSHDFMRPLKSMMGLNEVAKLSTIDPVAMEILQQANDTVVGMEKMQSKFLMLHYISRYPNLEDKISLQEVIGNLERKFIRRDQDSVTFNKDISKDLLGESNGRNMLLMYILENVFENAILFRNDKNITIDLSLKQLSNLKIVIQDNGVGIPKEYFTKVFDIYFRGNVASKGNGLGLYVVRKAIEKLGGKYQVESELDRYTRFTFEIPIDKKR